MKLLCTIALLLCLAMYLLYQPQEQFKGVPPTHFAEIDADGTVLRVIVASQEFINSGAVGDPANWIPTNPDGSIRKNYAGKGYTYDKAHDAFIPPKPSVPVYLDEVSGRWKLVTPDPKLYAEPQSQ